MHRPPSPQGPPTAHGTPGLDEAAGLRGTSRIPGCSPAAPRAVQPHELPGARGGSGLTAASLRKPSGSCPRTHAHTRLQTSFLHLPLQSAPRLPQRPCSTLQPPEKGASAGGVPRQTGALSSEGTRCLWGAIAAARAAEGTAGGEGTTLQPCAWLNHAAHRQALHCGTVLCLGTLLHRRTMNSPHTVPSSRSPPPSSAGAGRAAPQHQLAQGRLRPQHRRSAAKRCHGDTVQSSAGLQTTSTVSTRSVT